MLGWTLLAALYAIGLAYRVALDMVDRQPWAWRWSLLAWPLGALSYVFEQRAAIIKALRGGRP